MLDSPRWSQVITGQPNKYTYMPKIENRNIYRKGSKILTLTSLCERHRVINCIMKSFIFCKTWESHLGQSLPKTTAHPQCIPSAWSFTAQTTHGSNSEMKHFLTYWNRISKVMNYSFILTMKAKVLCKIKFQKIWCQHVNHLMNTGSFATHRLPPVSLVFKPASSWLASKMIGSCGNM